MKKISCLLCTLILLFSMSGCHPPSAQTTPGTDDSAQTGSGSGDFVPNQEPMYAVSVPTTTESVKAENGTLIFSYTHQTMALTLPDPDVARQIIVDFLNRVEAFRSTADATLDASKKADYNSANWIPYLCSTTYSPTRIDAGVLSLTGCNITFSGNAHPDRVSVSANYDLTTGDVLTLGSIMSSQASAQDFSRLVLDVLDQSKNQLYLYDGYESAVSQRFNQDVSKDQAWYFTPEGLCFYFEPYEIAPYSSGLIVAEIPYEKLSGLLNDRYFPAERVTAGGTVKIEGGDNIQLGDHPQIAEAVIDQSGQLVFLYTDGLLWDVEIAVGSWNSAGTEYTAAYTTLLCHTLSPGDAIRVQNIFDNADTALRLRFNTGNSEEVFYLKQNAKDGPIQLIK